MRSAELFFRCRHLQSHRRAIHVIKIGMARSRINGVRRPRASFVMRRLALQHLTPISVCSWRRPFSSPTLSCGASPFSFSCTNSSACFATYHCDQVSRTSSSSRTSSARPAWSITSHCYLHRLPQCKHRPISCPSAIRGWPPLHVWPLHSSSTRTGSPSGAHRWPPGA